MTEKGASPWVRPRLRDSIPSFWLDLRRALWGVEEPIGYPCMCGCEQTPIPTPTKTVRDDLYDSYNGWLARWYERSRLVKLVRDAECLIVAALDETWATMRGEPGSGACSHLHRTVDGYCPTCLRWVKVKRV